MEIEDKDYSIEELVELINKQEGEFIINIRLEEDDGYSERSL